MFLLNVNYKCALQTLHRAASYRKVVYKVPTFMNNSQNSQGIKLYKTKI